MNFSSWCLALNGYSSLIYDMTLHLITTSVCTLQNFLHASVCHLFHYWWLKTNIFEMPKIICCISRSILGHEFSQPRGPVNKTAHRCTGRGEILRSQCLVYILSDKSIFSCPPALCLEALLSIHNHLIMEYLKITE